jgi:iron complex transport system permease protein
MKVTLDLTKLLEEGRITQAEYEKFSRFSSQGTASLAFNILIGFGVIAVSGASLALVPTPAAAIVLGLVVAAAGVMLAQTHMQQWGVLANISILVGALLLGGGVLLLDNGSVGAFLLVTVIYSVAGVIARNGLLIVLAVLALSSSVGARTGYMHATYFLGIKEPTVTIALFSCLSFGLYQLSRRLAADYERLALMGARTAIFLVNFGFWVGSLWGERTKQMEMIASPGFFVIGWAAALIGTAVWAAKRNRRWVLNTVATFGAIHFYTQWFEHLGANPSTVLVAGVLALGFAVGIWQLNRQVPEPA